MPEHVEQPAPIPNDSPAIWPLVIADMHARDQLGRARYGTPLQAHNGRDALRDAYEESLDQTVYLRQAIEERDSPAEEAVTPGPRVEVEWPWDEVLVKGPDGTVVLHIEMMDDDYTAHCNVFNVACADVIWESEARRQAMVSIHMMEASDA